MPRFLSNLRNLSLWTGFLSLSPELFGNCKSKVFLFRGRSTLFAVCRGMRGGKLSLLGDPIQIKWNIEYIHVHVLRLKSWEKLRPVVRMCLNINGLDTTVVCTLVPDPSHRQFRSHEFRTNCGRIPDYVYT